MAPNPKELLAQKEGLQSNQKQKDGGNSSVNKGGHYAVYPRSLSEYATNPSLQQCSLAQSLSSSLQGHHNHHQQYPSSQLESVTRIALSSTEATPVPVLSITQPTSTSPPSSSQHPVGFYYGPFGSSVYPKYDGPNPFPYGFPPPGYSFSPYSRSIKENLPGQTSTNTNIVDCSDHLPNQHPVAMPPENHPPSVDEDKAEHSNSSHLSHKLTQILTSPINQTPIVVPIVTVSRSSDQPTSSSSARTAAIAEYRVTLPPLREPKPSANRSDFPVYPSLPSVSHNGHPANGSSPYVPPASWYNQPPPFYLWTYPPPNAASSSSSATNVSAPSSIRAEATVPVGPASIPAKFASQPVPPANANEAPAASILNSASSYPQPSYLPVYGMPYGYPYPPYPGFPVVQPTQSPQQPQAQSQSQAPASPVGSNGLPTSQPYYPPQYPFSNQPFSYYGMPPPGVQPFYNFQSPMQPYPPRPHMPSQSQEQPSSIPAPMFPLSNPVSRQHRGGGRPRLNKSYIRPKKTPEQRKQYPCSICQKKFSRPSSLKTHMHSHTGEKPYMCTIPDCGRHFSVLSNLRRHARICESRYLEQQKESALGPGPSLSEPGGSLLGSIIGGADEELDESHHEDELDEHMDEEDLEDDLPDIKTPDRLCSSLSDSNSHYSDEEEELSYADEHEIPNLSMIPAKPPFTVSSVDRMITKKRKRELSEEEMEDMNDAAASLDSLSREAIVVSPTAIDSAFPAQLSTWTKLRDESKDTLEHYLHRGLTEKQEHQFIVQQSFASIGPVTEETDNKVDEEGGAIQNGSIVSEGSSKLSGESAPSGLSNNSSDSNPSGSGGSSGSRLIGPTSDGSSTNPNGSSSTSPPKEKSPDSSDKSSPSGGSCSDSEPKHQVKDVLNVNAEKKDIPNISPSLSPSPVRA